MAQPVTEIVYINLKPGVDFNSPGQGAEVWLEALSTISSQDGFVGQRYGRQFENPEVLMLLIGTLQVISHILAYAAFHRLDKSGQA